MRILVTGATGFVGSHCAAALAEAGHAVRVLARTPDKLAAALEPHGSPAVEVHQGDVLQRDSLTAALDGCDGVLHAANVYTLDPRRREEMFRTNTEGTSNVIELAHAAGCDPIVHVSSVVALYPARTLIPADPPMGSNTSSPYVRSKVAAEAIARRFQDQGLPVTITYPGVVWGPHDPVPGDLVHMLRCWLANLWPFLFFKSGGFSLADVRWVARAHAALFVPGKGARRVTMGGRYLGWNDVFVALRAVTGRRLPQLVPTPALVAQLSGRLCDVAQRFVGLRLPLAYENVWLLFNSAPTTDTLATELAGPPPAFEQTAADAIQWAARAGHISAKAAGKLAVADSSA